MPDAVNCHTITGLSIIFFEEAADPSALSEKFLLAIQISDHMIARPPVDRERAGCYDGDISTSDAIFGKGCSDITQIEVIVVQVAFCKDRKADQSFTLLARMCRCRERGEAFFF